LTATHAAPAASITAAQWAVTASAARSAAEPPPPASAIASGHSRCGSGSRPMTTCDSRAATRAGEPVGEPRTASASSSAGVAALLGGAPPDGWFDVGGGCVRR
jgi:hypothetical protein